MPLTKTTWMIAPPIWFLLWILWRFLCRKKETKPLFRQFVSIFLIGLYVLNMGYFFDGSFRLLNQYRFISGTLTNTEVTKNSPIQPGNRFKDSWLGFIPVPLPAEFVRGIDTQKLDFERGKESYACGVWSDRGWWWYYCFALLLKEPVGVLGLMLMALTMTCFGKNNFYFRDELVIFLPMILFFVFVSSQTGISAHPRYVIPILPMGYIFISKIFSKKIKFLINFRLTNSARHASIRKIQFAAIIFVTWAVISSLLIYPHSMSYFNELIGGPVNGPKYLLGSCIDWGQDEYELRDWVRKHPEARPLYVSYSPSIPLNVLGIQSDGLVPEQPGIGWMVIGVNDLYGQDGRYVRYRELRPAKKIGGVFVFLTQKVEKIPDTSE
jgi:hypothetical protein